MKISSILTIVSAALLVLCAGPARATSWDFFNHDNNYSDFGKSNNGDNDSNWSSTDNQDGKKGNDNSNIFKFSKWSGDESHIGGDGKYSDEYRGDKGNAPPPQCADADPGRGKWDGDKVDRSDNNGAYGWSDDRDDKDKWGRNFYKKICDKDRGKGYGHHHRCDPGNPVPLPDSLPIFASAVALLVLRRKSFDRIAK